MLPCHLIYWLCFPPCSVANMAPLPLLSEVAGRSCVRAVIPYVSGGRKAHSGPATHWPPTMFSSALSTVLGLDELIHYPSTRRVQGRRHSAKQRNNQRLVCMHCWFWFQKMLITAEQRARPSCIFMLKSNPSPLSIAAVLLENDSGT